jgi:hypothetical protein
MFHISFIESSSRRHATMLRSITILITGSTLCTIGLLSASAQEPKKGEKAEIPGGIEGHVKSVDVEKQTLSIKTSTGTERTFRITNDTTMIGPRGGKVRNRLKDRRFHEGMEVTIVAQGTTAKEVHLGYDRRNAQGSTESTSTSGARVPAKKRETTTVTKATKPAPRVAGKLAAAKAAKAAVQEEADEDDEIPGKVKSYDAARRHLVVTLLNGKSRSWFLASDLKVVVRGTASKLGLKDPALKVGAPVTVFVEAGSRRVRELHIDRAPVTKAKSAA